LRQHSRNKGWDIRHASIDGGKVAYAVGADIHLLDLASGADQKVAITLGGDFDQQRERFIKRPQDFLGHVAMAPDGERVLLSARGHLATQGVGALRRAELPQPAEGRCRQAEFSADSKNVFGLCDFGGETEVWRFAANGLGKPEALTSGATTLRKELSPSPDGRYLAHTDKEGRIYLTDLQAKGGAATRLIDQDRIGSGPEGLSWSPDGKALAFTRPARVRERDQLMLYTLADGRLTQLSSDRYDNASPTFSPDGHWLYFLSRRSFAVTGNGGPWGDRNMGPYFDRGTRIYALALQPGQRFPFAPRDELDGGKGKKDEAKKDEAKPEDKTAGKDAKPDEKKPEGGKKDALPAIVTAGLAERLFEVPLPPGNYSELRSNGKQLWYLDTELTTDRKSALKALPIGNNEDKPETVAADVRSYALSADGKKLMVQRMAGGAREILLVDAAPKLPGELGKFQVRWSDWAIATDPKSEWRQMFADAWRMHRDYFYDKAMHGVDWKAVRAKYEPLVDRVTDRAELGDLLGQMSSELGALHSQIGMPDLRAGSEDPGLAGLGARLSRQADGWRIDRIYAGDPELPDELAPLAAPGLGIQAGDVITAINGRSALEAADPSELLRGQAGRQVLLQIKQAGASAPISRIVTPVNQRREQALRYGDWRFTRAQAVQQQGQGRIGYVHLRAMGRDDIADFAREFYAQFDREGLIIDVRHNNGGNIDSWILEKLLRRAWAYWQSRSPDGAKAYPNMQQAFRGHVVILINEETYSDGETFAEGFKRLGLGKAIGKRTSGAGVWLSDQNRLLDNGLARAAENGQILADGRFLIEGIGVSPDIEVDNPPRASFEGRDAQLEAAIAELHKEMAAEPMVQPKPGAYPRPVRP
jgi:tricorn protease